jgi:nitroreductase
MGTDRRGVILGAAGLAAGAVGVSWLAVRGIGSMTDYEASVARTRAALGQTPQTRDLIRHATLAASGHNAQPWRFRVMPARIDVLPDFARRTAVVDPDDHHLFASLGCAPETLSLAAGAQGRPGTLAFDPAEGGSLAFNEGDGPAPEPDLADAIARRQCTRAEYDGRPVAPADMRALEAAAAGAPGVATVLLTGRAQIDAVRDLVVAGNDAQMADPAFMRELKDWLRFSPRAAMTRGDGLFAASSGAPALPDWLGPFVFDRIVTAAAERDRYAAQMNSSAGVAVFAAERADPEGWVAAGRACQRFMLRATALGLKCAFVNQPVEVATLRPAMAALIGLPTRRPDLVLRFGHGPTLPFSARRPVDAVLA